jgi:hypothetical protein
MKTPEVQREVTCNTILDDVRDLAGRLLRPWTLTADLPGFLPSIRGIRQDLHRHIQEMEGIGGLLQCILRECPRLNMGVDRLADEHQALLRLLGELEQTIGYAKGPPDTAGRVRTIASQMLQIVEQHYQAGNSLVLEAYGTDIGTKD